MTSLAIALPSGRVARVIAYAWGGIVGTVIARADASGRVYELGSLKQYPIAYEHIAKRLDALELQSKAELSAELRRVRSDLATKLKAAKSSKVFKALPRRKELQASMGAMLRRAWEAGCEAIREEVPRAYADSSFTPKAATKWLADAEFWITDLLSDDLLSVAQRIIVNGLKTGKPASTMMVELFEAFVPYLGSRVGENVIEPARLETIVRTNTTTAYNHGRLTEILGADVARFVDGIRYSAVLDSRTTEVCRFLDGKVFILPAGAKYRNLPATPEVDIEALIPPRHFNCRSLIVPIVVGSTINPDDVITAAEVAQAKALSGEGFMLQRGVFKNYDG